MREPRKLIKREWDFRLRNNKMPQKDNPDLNTFSQDRLVRLIEAAKIALASPFSIGEKAEETVEQRRQGAFQVLKRKYHLGAQGIRNILQYRKDNLIGE